MKEDNTTSSEKLWLEPGTLWTKVTRQTDYARQCGALQSIETEYEFIEQDGIVFLVRTLSNLARKEKAKIQQNHFKVKTGKDFNPFLPYEEDLFVTDLSPTHLCLLNKFNVVDYHLLIVTRTFEEQENLLNEQDFAALWACLQEIDGLAFYNGGKIAGASQRHKHLQLVPLPFIPQESYLPIEPAIAAAVFQNSVGKISSFPFRHALAKLNLDPTQTVTAVAKKMLSYYYCLLAAVGLPVNENERRQPGAYNLLATREWMLIVPRSQESFHSISVNSLGFAGSLFVRDRRQKKLLQELRPINLLCKVAIN
ncbi:phosphorylase [Pleurocapsales cyanobacterium LEGE 06147]|nr:phosphorylase [Pleurocapsales cyanobacterium LEGE 06147]